MTARHLVVFAALGSAILLMGAFVFQAFGYAPCQMCYWQRWPHGLAITFALIALYDMTWIWIAAGALSAAATSAIGFFHAGVELKFWEGPQSCTGGGGGIGNMSGNDLLSVDVIDKVVMCDQVSWAFAGISMAGWNGILSAALFGAWATALVWHLRRS